MRRRQYLKRRSGGRKRRGYSAVLTTSMMLAAVSILGSSLLIWANMSFDIRRETAAELFEEGSNVLKESLVVEDVWFDAGAPKYVNVTLRNVGGIVVNVTEVSLNGTVVWSQSVIVDTGGDVTVYAVYSWSVGMYTVEVETERGSLLTGVWKAVE